MAKPKKAAKKAAAKKEKKSGKPAAKGKPAKAKATKVIAKAKAKPKVKAKVAKAKAAKKAAKVAKKPVAVKAVPKPKEAGKGAKQAVVTEAEGAPEKPTTVEEIVLTDAEGRRYCRVKDCDQLATVDNYCRYHYLLYWKKIQIRKKILTEGKLERYIEELTARYPDKYLEMLRKDLRSDKEFLAAIQELEIDESAVEGEFEDESDTYIEEVRGISEPSTRGEDEF